MEVILLEKIHNLGDLGETVKVKSGFARNFLVPQGKAIPASRENLAVFEARRAELEQKAAETLAEARKVADKLMTNKTLVLPVQVGSQGKLYGSITSIDVIKLIKAEGIEVSRKELIMSQDVIREVGEYTVSIQLHPDVLVELNLQVVDAVTGSFEKPVKATAESEVESEEESIEEIPEERDQEETEQKQD